MELEYRTCSTEDVEEIYEYARKLIMRYEDPTIMDLKKALMWTRTKVEGNCNAYTSVWKDGSKVAYYHLMEEMDFSYQLDDLFVLDGYRNEGIGHEILQHIIDTTDDTIYLYVFVKNTRAIALYEEFGFTVKKKVSPTRIIMERKHRS